MDEQLFFHASELVRPEEQAKTPFLDFISPGDEVEFVVGQNTGSRMNLVAQKACSHLLFIPSLPPLDLLDRKWQIPPQKVIN